MRRRRQAPEPARLLAIYLRHHASASAGGVDLFHRAAGGVQDAEARRELRSLTEEVAQDRAALVKVMHALGVPRSRVGEVLVGWAETVARLKPNGTLVRRSPLSDVVELESLVVAVQAKRLGWLSLRRLADSDPRLDAASLDAAAARALDQEHRLERLRERAVDRAFVGR